MPRHRAFTLVELVFAIVVAAILVTIVLVLAKVRPEESRRPKCKNHLRQLGMGMIQYIDLYGKGRYYSWPGPQKPSFNGAQWIASMYWGSVVNEPDLYICPSSVDDNDNGGCLGRQFKALRAIDVSYAGRNGMMGALTEKMPGNTVMMSDDTQDPANHEDGVNLLYFDGRVKWLTSVSPLAGGEKGKARLGKDKPVDVLRN